MYLHSFYLDSPVNKPKLKLCKQILGLKRNSSSLAVYGELSIIPTALLGIVRIIKFWHRISHLNDDTLIKIALTISHLGRGVDSTPQPSFCLLLLTDATQHPKITQV